jgi:pimeloyl-ACP methyl ester carboxylesterase
VAARLENTPAGLAASLRTAGTGTMVPAWDRLADLAMPTLVVAGAEDPKYAPLAARLAAGIGANAQLALVPGAGHAVPFEAPAEFARLVRGFLGRL